MAYEHLTTASFGKSSHAEWVINSSASSHICMSCDWFISYSTLHTPHPIILGNKQVIHAVGLGQIDIMIHNDLGDHHAIVKDVLFCPHISTNLLSINQLTHLSVNVQFIGKECQILNADKSPISIAHLSDGLYQLPCTVNGIEKAYVHH